MQEEEFQAQVQVLDLAQDLVQDLVLDQEQAQVQVQDRDSLIQGVLFNLFHMPEFKEI